MQGFALEQTHPPASLAWEFVVPWSKTKRHELFFILHALKLFYK